MGKVTITFTVLGHPEPGGSKRAVSVPGGGVNVIDANRKVQPWRALVASAGERAMYDALSGVLTGPLAVAFLFYLRRPQGHYRTGRFGGIVKDSAPRRPTSRPDVSKLIRAAEDALTSIVWRDDAQIVTQIGQKFFGEPERCKVIVQGWVTERNGTHAQCETAT